MRKVFLFGILVFIFIVGTLSVSAWINCTPSACGTGYTNNGIYCAGGTCYRNCTISTCDNNWVSVSSTTFGFSVSNTDEKTATSGGYTPTNSSLCYNFTYYGPTANNNYIDIYVTGTPPQDCDSEMIGGFRQGFTPWFSGMSSYIGPQTNSDVEHMNKQVRAHTEASSNSDQNYLDEAAKDGSIYCAPNLVACSLLGGTSICDTDCYTVATSGHVVQGYYKDKGNPDTSLYDGAGCGNSYVTTNKMLSVNYTVYETTATTGYESDTSCARTNEAPSAFNVTVLPLNATLGHDLFCDYNYYDPEGYTEKDSSYEWWKNGVNQNFNFIILHKGNLTLNDVWYCKVKPNDGLLDGNMTQSGNNITILSTVKDVQMYVNGTWVWNTSGYFVGPEMVLNLTDALNQALQGCIPDAENYCTINLTYSSTAVGKLNLSRMGIYFYQPTANETEGELAIEQGINNSLTSHNIYTDQQIYVRYLNNLQKKGRFDKVVTKNNQTWAFNFITGNETFTNITGLFNSTLVVWENQTLTPFQIKQQVENIIAKTKW